MKKVCLFALALSLALTALLLVGCGHTHEFTREVVNERYEKVKVTCGQEGEYYKSCACGEAGTETFTVLRYSHDFGEAVSNGDGTHSRTCSRDATHITVFDCTGGTATCDALAVCKDCGGEYGTLAPCDYDENGICKNCELPIPTEGLAFTLTDGGYAYELLGAGVSTDTEISVPAYYKGLPVVRVAAIAFYGNKTVTKIYLPNTVREIGSEAFCDASNLTYVRAGAALESIEKSAFASCTSLLALDRATCLRKIGANAFYNCTSLASAPLCDTLEEVGDGAFYGAQALTFTEFSHTRYLGSPNNAYLYLYRVSDLYLESYEIHPDCRFIANGAFRNCEKVTEITIPDSVIGIGASAFEKCKGLLSVKIGNGVRVIPDSAFSYCTHLQTATLGDNVTHIEYCAFYYCERLQTLTVPDTLIYVNASALTYAYNLNYNKNADGHWYLGNGHNPYVLFVSVGGSNTRVTERIEDGCRVIAHGAFFHTKTRLQTLILPASLKGIVAGAFNMASIPSEVLFLGTPDDWAMIHFSGYSANPITEKNEDGKYPTLSFNGEVAKDLTFSTATAINPYAFYKCQTIESVTLGPQLTYVGTNAFADSSITSLVSLGTKEIGYGAFYNCKALEEVTLAETTEIIEADAFRDCDALEEITLPDRVQKIGTYLFQSCDALKSVTLGERISYLSPYLFEYCYSLETVNVRGVLRGAGNGPFVFVNADLVIHYAGTMKEWQALNCLIPYQATVHCADGDILPG